MKFLRYLIALFILITPAVVMALPTQYGESGLISVPTTDITGRGVFEAGAWLNSSMNNENRFTILPLSFSMGIANGVEISGSYPSISLNNQIEGSLRSFENIGVKYRLSGTADSAFKAALNAFLRQTISEDKMLNGLLDSGARLILGYRLTNANINFNVGYLKVERPSLGDYENEIIYGGAIDFPIFQRAKPFVEVDGNTVRTGGPPRVEITPGIAYYLLSNLTIISGVGVGLTDAGPDYRVMVGLTFSSGAGRYVKAIPVIPGSRERFAEASMTPEELMPEIDILPGELGAEKAGTPLTPMPGLEGLGTSTDQPLSEDMPMPVTKPGSKEVIAPASLIGQEEIAPVPLEPPMPVLMTMPAETAVTKIDKAPLKPEIPAEVPAVVFAPPTPVSTKTGSVQGKVEDKEGSKPAEIIEPQAVDKGIPSSVPKPVKKAEGMMAKPEIPAEVPAVTFAPPMPVTVAKAGTPGTEPPVSKPGTPVETEPVIMQESAGTAPVEKTPLKPEPPALARKAETAAVPVAPAATPVMAAPVIVTEIPVTKAAPPIKKKVETTPTEHRVVLQGDILFAFNKWEVTSLGGESLDVIIKEIQDGKGTVVAVKLEGHTDSTGSSGYNKRLSYKRAESVKRYLVSKGIKAGIVSVEGFGEDRPVASNDTPEGMDKNRRVEIIISYKQLINQGQ